MGLLSLSCVKFLALQTLYIHGYACPIDAERLHTCTPAHMPIV